MSSAKQKQGVVVQIARNFKDIDITISKLEELARFVCNRFQVSAATVSIAIVDDSEFCRLNKEFLNRKSTSDCLSFDLSDDNDGKFFELVQLEPIFNSPEYQKYMLGKINNDKFLQSYISCF